MINKIKEILKPSKKKLALTLGLLLAASVIFTFLHDLLYTFYTGIYSPLPIYSKEAVCPTIDSLGNVTAGTSDLQCPDPETHPVMLLANIGIWYISSSVILHFRGGEE